jgi:hypothetical protein
LTHLTNIRTGNRGAHTDIARIAAKEIAIIPASDAVTPIPIPIRIVIVIIMTTTEEKLAIRSCTNAMRDAFVMEA